MGVPLPDQQTLNNEVKQKRELRKKKIIITKSCLVEVLWVKQEHLSIFFFFSFSSFFGIAQKSH